MVTPEEAVAELAHCRELGLKVVGLPEGVTRPIPKPDPHSPSPFLVPGQAHWFDTFGLDSAHDYDPVWQALTDSGFAAVFHGGIGHIAPYTFTSITSYVFNHIGFFAERMHRLCKSLFLGGVTRRFPDLNIAFLECGVGWACSLLVDIVEHWEKRNLDALQENLDPALVDWDLFEQLMTHVRRQAAGRGRGAAREPAVDPRRRGAAGGTRRVPPSRRHQRSRAARSVRPAVLLRLRG